MESKSDPIYCPENVPLFEALYGKNLISLGGLAAIDNMFSDLNIKNLKALDLGFGLGGVAFYLAKTYSMSISGVEVHLWLAEYAKNHAPKNLINNLDFTIYNIKGEFPYQSNSFDLVYSKGVLNHVADKKTLFLQVNRALKANGLFVIADWIFPEAKAPSAEGLVCETKASYEKVLANTGFHEITFRDDSKMFLGYVKNFLENLTVQQAFIEKKYNKDIFEMIKKQHEDLIENIQEKRKIATRIIARKIS